MNDRYGSGAVSVIALHGSPANRKTWRTLVPYLPEGVTLVAPDLPGHGSRRDVPFRIDTSLEVVAESIEFERSENRAGGPARTVIVAGDSLGGYLAIASGARLDGVDAIVAGGCSFEMRGLASALAMASDIPVRIALRAFGAARLEAALRRLLSGREDDEATRDFIAAGVRFEARGESIRALAEIRTGALVEACRVPIVFVNGSRDWPTRAHERRFLRLARRAEVMLAPGSPHAVSHFAPDVFARAIARALDMVGGPEGIVS